MSAPIITMLATGNKRYLMLQEYIASYLLTYELTDNSLTLMGVQYIVYA